MSPTFIAFVSLLVLAQVALPTRYAFLPLMLAGLHLGNVEILPELTTARLLILIGLTRATVGGFAVWPTSLSLDRVFIAFCIIVLLSTLGHKPDEYFGSPLGARLGLVFNTFGSYLYARAYIPDIAAFRRYTTLLLFALLPLGVGMTLEQATGRNYYFFLGSRSEMSAVRDGKVRASGPFQHPILAGTAGATVLPFAYLLWRGGRRKSALIGLGACLSVVLACASSGPLAAVAVTVAAILFWRWRHHLSRVLWGIAFVALLYNIVKGRGPWYLMASIDLVGGSTGWHRAKLIDQSFVYLNEWWLFGTDYTRHWMASGVRWNPNMVDLTNYYIHLGVTGGLALSLALIGLIVAAFRLLSKRVQELRLNADPDEMALWCAGASLAGHAVSFISISYFDQMYIFFYLLLGAIPGLVATAGSSPPPTGSLAVQTPVPVPAAALKPLRFYS